MVTRRVFLEIGAAGLALAAIRWSTVGPSAAETFAVNYSEDEWHKRLTPNQYAVLRQAATENSLHQPAAARGAPRQLRVRGLRSRPVLVVDEVRQRHRLAEFLGTARQGGRHHQG